MEHKNTVTTAKHTPGFEPRYGEMEIIEAEGKFIIRQKNNGAFFASTYSRVDAHLIAATPKLLSALVNATKLLRLVGTTWTDESDAHRKAYRVADEAEAAIAKATGATA